MALLLTDPDIRQVLTMADCLEALETAYRDRAVGLTTGGTTRVETVVPTARPGLSFAFTSMEGAVPAFGLMALRVNAYHFAQAAGPEPPGHIPKARASLRPGLVLLFSIEELRLVAILHDPFISLMRVGATSALAARCLARSEAHVVGVLGAGAQARTQLLGLAQVRAIQEVRVFSPTPEHRRNFAEAMTSVLRLPVRPVDEPQKALQGADIVALATNSTMPVIEAGWLEAGMHVGAIQSAELPAELYQRAEVVVVNAHSGYGRGAAGHYDASADWMRYPTLDQILAGMAPGRTGAGQVSFFMNAGVGFQFAAVGYTVLEAARRAGIGMELPDGLFPGIAR